MKVLTAEQLRKCDQFTIANEPISSIDLMERAALKCFQWIMSNCDPDRSFLIFCGTGNNGGDGLAIARMLKKEDKNISLFIVGDPEKGSVDFRHNLSRLQELDFTPLRIHDDSDIPVIEKGIIVIDAIFGTGLTRKPSGIHKTVIRAINASENEILSIDIPSGLFAEDNTAVSKEEIIHATNTLTFHCPKLSFLLPDQGACAGDWQVLDIGLSEKCIGPDEVYLFYTQLIDLKSLLKQRDKFAHKGSFGHSLIVAGSYGKIGAAVLATGAALKVGSGLVSSFVPVCGYGIIQAAVPEAMCLTSKSTEHLSGTIDLSGFNSIGIGPGIGKNSETLLTLRDLISKVKCPLVVDADALNLISENNDLLGLLPANSILTPHPKEFDRLFGKCASAYERLMKQREQSLQNRLIIILKGAYTSVSLPDGSIYFNSTGNPGMATGGSGDVLTGMITGLLAQGYTPKEAALAGVYFHGNAGDIAMNSVLQKAITAGDIIRSYRLKKT